MDLSLFVGLPVTSILLGYQEDGLMGQVWYLVVWYYNWMVMMRMEPLPVQFVLVVTAREIKLHCDHLATRFIILIK